MTRIVTLQAQHYVSSPGEAGCFQPSFTSSLATSTLASTYSAISILNLMYFTYKKPYYLVADRMLRNVQLQDNGVFCNILYSSELIIAQLLFIGCG